MERAFQVAKVVAVFAVAAFFATGADCFVRLQRAIDHADGAVQATQQKVGIVLDHADEAAKHSAEASLDTRRAIVHFDRTLGDVRSGVAGLRQLVAHTDKNLNAKGGVLYQADKLLADSNAALNDEKTGLIPSATLAVLVAGNGVRLVSDATLPVLYHADDLVNSPAVKGSLSSTDAAMKHVNNVADAVDKLAHPPKRSRGQRALQWILQTVLGNAVQGVVRR